TLMLPAILVLLNLALVPRGLGWFGAQTQLHVGAVAIAEPADVRRLAASIPVWTPEGGRNHEQQKLRYFLILANDHRVAIYVSKFLSQCLQGFHFPVLAWLLYGLTRSRRGYWKPERDL